MICLRFQFSYTGITYHSFSYHIINISHFSYQALDFFTFQGVERCSGNIFLDLMCTETLYTIFFQHLYIYTISFHTLIQRIILSLSCMPITSIILLSLFLSLWWQIEIWVSKNYFPFFFVCISFYMQFFFVSYNLYSWSIQSLICQ